MKFDGKLIKGCLIRRYKRFLADVELEDGQVVTAHTANTGAMTGCAEAGSTVWLSRSNNPKRKYRYTWELVQVSSESSESGTTLVGINTMRSNHLVKEAIQAGRIPCLNHYDSIKTEVPYGENSRIDLLLCGPDYDHSQKCFIEVKNVTLVRGSSAYFPDAVSKRASKHLKELVQVVQAGNRAVMFFCVQRDDVQQVCPAAAIDPEYANAFALALAQGVEAMAYVAQVSPGFIQLTREVLVYSDDRNC